MPPDGDAREVAGLWLDYAKADLALAGAPLPQGARYELLLFHAQQTVNWAEHYIDA